MLHPGQDTSVRNRTQLRCAISRDRLHGMLSARRERNGEISIGGLIAAKSAKVRSMGHGTETKLWIDSAAYRLRLTGRPPDRVRRARDRPGRHLLRPILVGKGRRKRRKCRCGPCAEDFVWDHPAASGTRRGLRTRDMIEILVATLDGQSPHGGLRRRRHHDANLRAFILDARVRGAWNIGAPRM